jgi:hypothetical protein
MERSINMKEYIERNTICEKCNNKKYCFSETPNEEEKLKCPVYKVSAADVVEIRYGRWLKQENETYLPVEFDENDEPILHKYIYYKCSLCGRTENQKEPYCNCGARMDKEN